MNPCSRCGRRTNTQALTTVTMGRLAFNWCPRCFDEFDHWLVESDPVRPRERGGVLVEQGH